MLRPRPVARLGRMMRLIVSLRRMLRLVAWLGRNITLPCLALDIVLVVTGPDVLIEDGPVSTLESVLFSIRVTEMINLKPINLVKHPNVTNVLQTNKVGRYNSNSQKTTQKW